MTFELDHLSIYTAIGAPEAARLLSFGLTEGTPNIHNIILMEHLRTKLPQLLAERTPKCLICRKHFLNWYNLELTSPSK
ncbi:hypothetical protein NIES593_00980 [Hydrococcus rivularis NIES-593]|uniref:Uncharacterized protein n=1 Tax=Hydrococcus rivularis NIES-593 TaxID=1921803 RepID=A0A1U7HSU4_9CYAN|nr:hypothetical protein [Hydrococcus rivularis]OKH26663.1 hypothetical protein NIES593_00980 [Hydrococcus rivularis NIES-593]